MQGAEMMIRKPLVLAALLVLPSIAFSQNAKPLEETLGSPQQPARAITAPSGACAGTLTITNPTFNRPLSFAQGGTCSLSGTGTAVRYQTHAINVAATSNITLSLVPADGASITPAEADTFLVLYGPGGFNPAAPCTNAIAANDDAVGLLSRITTTTPLPAGNYTAVVTSFANTPSGAGALPWTYSLALDNATCGGGGPVGPTYTVTPTAAAFPATEVGSASTIAYTVTNTSPPGGSALTITGCTFGGANPGDFSLTNPVPVFPFTIPVGFFATGDVRFSPTQPGARSATLTCVTNAAAPNTTFTVNLTGTGTVPFRPVPSTSALGQWLLLSLVLGMGMFFVTRRQG
jgi:hypothetical protein